MPVLAVPEGLRWPRIAQAVSDERYRAAQDYARLPGEVLAWLRSWSARDGGVQALTEWLARTVAGEVTLTAGTGEPMAWAPAGAREIAEQAAPTIARVATRQLDSAALDVGSRQVRLLPIGHSTPRPVLAVARRAPFDAADICAVTCVADVLPLLLQVREVNARERQAHRLLSAAQVGVLQMLMGGELLLAQRTAASIEPGLLDAEQGRVLILEGRPEDRTAAIQECGAAMRGSALVVRCPVYDGNVIIVAPVRQDGRDGDWDDICAELRKVVAARPDRYLGGSGAAPLAATAQSYRDAARALAVARHVSERTVLTGAQIQLVEVLDRRARPWAERLLQPVLALPRGDRDQLLDMLGLVLEFGVAGTARLTGRHRNTVSGTRKRVGALLGLDLSDVLVRTRLDLALQVLSCTVPSAGSSPAAPPAASLPDLLPDLLATAPVRGWAQRWLAPLAQDGRDLRRTLLAWVGCNTRVEGAAAQLGLYPDTVRDHLKAADRLLQRDLMSPSGPHDLVLTLLATGALPLPREREQERGTG